MPDPKPPPLGVATFARTAQLRRQLVGERDDFDKRDALDGLRNKRLNAYQARAMKDIFQYSKHENDFDENWAFGRLRDSGNLTARMASVVGKMARFAKDRDGLESSTALTFLLRHGEITGPQQRVLEAIIEHGSDNGLDETLAFKETLDTEELTAAEANQLVSLLRRAKRGDVGNISTSDVEGDNLRNIVRWARRSGT